MAESGPLHPLGHAREYADDAGMMRMYDCATGNAMSELGCVMLCANGTVSCVVWAPDMCSIVVLADDRVTTFELC